MARQTIDALIAALDPIEKIFRAYRTEELSEANPFRGDDPTSAVLVSSRGGRTLLTVQQVLDIETAIKAHYDQAVSNEEPSPEPIKLSLDIVRTWLLNQPFGTVVRLLTDARSHFDGQWYETLRKSDVITWLQNSRRCTIKEVLEKIAPNFPAVSDEQRAVIDAAVAYREKFRELQDLRPHIGFDDSITDAPRMQRHIAQLSRAEADVFDASAALYEAVTTLIFSGKPLYS